MMPSLYTQLAPALECPLTGRKYIGNLDTLLEQIITLPAVIELLTRKLKRQWLPCWDGNHENRIQGARKVIAVLVLLRLPDTIESLLLEELTDEDLPLSRNGFDLQSGSRKKVFESFTDWEPDDVDRFLKKQWRVLKPKLELDLDAKTAINIQFEPHYALTPAFLFCDEVAKTEFSTVYKGAFKPSCLSKSDYRTNSGNPICVAIKKFSRVPDFDKEKETLDTICSNNINNDHIVTHLATCAQVPFIIFPWADGGDLAQFWLRECARKRDDFLWFLEQMAGLAHALADLHKDHINTRHGDLKPANILCFTQKGILILKIADFGIARTHTQKTGFIRGKTITTVSTRAYEAPEATTTSPRSRRYDCWSMGCIILEYIVWLLYDFTALENFTGNLDPNEYQYYRTKSVSDYQNKGAREMWEVHPNVIELMNCLRDDKRCRHTALEALVNIADKNLLQVGYEDRLEAVDLHKELHQVFDRAKKDPSYVVNMDARPKETPQILSQSPSRSNPRSTSDRKLL